MTAVSVEDLSKSYGSVRALDDVSLTVREGEIFGLVGPNGAGKTTTLRILATLLGPTAGSVEVFDHDVEADPNAVRAAIRYLPAEAGAYDNMTGRQYLEFIAGFYPDAAGPQVERGIEIADLGERIDDKTSEYSTGMTRKLLVASALMTDPELAILDEVTTGLDVRNARRVRDIIDDYPDDGRSVLLSSHDMLEVSYLCDRVALLDGGSVVGVGTPAELCERFGGENLEDAFLEATA
ncbi:ABC transporter ATP-binding protein [Halorussus halobius]|uniref:ABC transporter ATP-binding protein n=1 Tax=Halorussus halobius TaxID=1710537 RepID=UPI0010925139|nr:ABC transporter ATP-binding protein [Halorussus halobius]